ncbi:hypothetical protein [Halorubrum aethiopicum]|uniref:hypothetical protein n=1 Tax=Halorubrum aethiopicum TaxID=1758255 RepID=UPI00082B1DAE|nr:hypothetical protein [Halorubrum aethiopicum]
MSEQSGDDSAIEAAERFWSRYEIPFEHDTAIKLRRSGLLRGSTGTGHAANTVVHLHVKEGFTDGRLSRTEDSWLCENDSYVPRESREERFVEDGEEYVPPVTCETCLDRMERWNTVVTDGGVSESDPDEQSVPEQIRDAIESSEYPELSFREAAERTGLTEQQVRSAAGSMDRLELDQRVGVVRLPEDDGGELVDDPEQGLLTDGGMAVGSYDDLQPEPEQPIDRNPSMPCEICGESFTWLDYWKDRILDGDGDPSEASFWCDDCEAEIETTRRRLSNNASLDEWVGDVDTRGADDGE